MEIQHKGIIIPHDRLSQTALLGLIEEFVTRDGTDTGFIDGSLEGNVEMVIRQLDRGDVLIIYDEATQTVNIVPKEYSRSIFQEEG
ncbi:MAG: YheU family protein [Pseudomonadota bacterium]